MNAWPSKLRNCSYMKLRSTWKWGWTAEWRSAGCSHQDL